MFMNRHWPRGTSISGTPKASIRYEVPGGAESLRRSNSSVLLARIRFKPNPNGNVFFRAKDDGSEQPVKSTSEPTVQEWSWLFKCILLGGRGLVIIFSVPARMSRVAGDERGKAVSREVLWPVHCYFPVLPVVLSPR